MESFIDKTGLIRLINSTIGTTKYLGQVRLALSELFILISPQLFTIYEKVTSQTIVTAFNCQ